MEKVFISWKSSTPKGSFVGISRISPEGLYTQPVCLRCTQAFYDSVTELSEIEITKGLF